MNLNGSQPLVSIITPVYNGEKYVIEVLEAVAAQTWASIEHIIVNDGSTDRTLELVKAFAANSDQVLLIDQVNAGEAEAVNRGYAASSGEFLIVVNADDPPYPELVEQTMLLMLEQPGLSVVYPDWDLIDADGELVAPTDTLDYDQQALIGDFVCIPGPGALIRRSAVLGDLRRRRYRYVADYDLWLRLSLSGPMQRCPNVLASWRDHPMGASSRAAGVNICREYVAVINDFFSRDDLPPHVLAWERQARSMSAYHASLQCIHSREVPGRSLMFSSITIPFRRHRRYRTRRRHPFAMIGVLILGSNFRLVVRADRRLKQVLRVFR